MSSLYELSLRTQCPFSQKETGLLISPRLIVFREFSARFVRSWSRNVILLLSAGPEEVLFGALELQHF